VENHSFLVVFDGKHLGELEDDFRTVELASFTEVTLALLDKQDAFMVDQDT
jgi:hypothetical protein